MHLSKAIFINRAPFDNLELSFQEQGINVLSAINGRGKTTILSYIVDAFHEMARPYFRNSYNGIENTYYRLSSPIFQPDSASCSIVYLRFVHDDEIVDYIDCRGPISRESYESSIKLPDCIPFDRIISKLKDNACAKIVSANYGKEKAIQIFGHNILTYFPSYRYEKPIYLTSPYEQQLEFKKEGGLSGTLVNPIETISNLPQLANWIMDVVLDWEIYKQTEVVQLPNQTKTTIDRTPELRLFNNLNNILNATLSTKSPNGRIRFGIGKRNNSGQRISIMRDTQTTTERLSPSIFCLSSGEASLLSMFGEILRQGDRLESNIETSKISGIVIIDEIDKHLHIRLQKEVLPKLFILFPQIQFIISSHSPFLHMGLADTLLNRSQIIDLDNNGINVSPTNNDLYREVYEMMIRENNRFAEKYEEIEARLKEFSKPIVITEGKTDIKHILKAKEKLSINDIDFDCIEIEHQPDGDGNLNKLLEHLSKVVRKNIIIGIFDRDSDIVKDIEKDNQPYKIYGNNVYAFCLQVPQSRIDSGQPKISIEYLYSDEEIQTTLDNGCRLFFGTEFMRQSMRHNTEDLTLNKPQGKGVDKIIENNGGQAVYDKNDTNILAKKEDFANAIVNDKLNISNSSWENFRHIFDRIKTILAL